MVHGRVTKGVTPAAILQCGEQMGKLQHFYFPWIVSFKKTDRNVRLECYEMGCWRRMENINWTDRVKNEDVLQIYSYRRKKNILHRIKRRKLTGFFTACVGIAC